MATKQTKGAATTAPSAEDKKKQMEAARMARESAARGDKFKYLGQVKEGAKKLAPQAQVIVNTIEAAGKGGLTREELVKNLDGVLVTRQPIGRIVSYYQKALVDSGHIVIEAAKAA